MGWRDYTVWKEMVELEANSTVKVIIAAISGSRCWGFESEDSDYDVCFIYRCPEDFYLSPFQKKDTITFEKEIEGKRFEFKGWDVKKALYLMHQGNVQPHEWLAYDSPFNREESDLLRMLSRRTWNPQVAIRHYLGIAYGNWKKYISNSDTPKTKRYLYVARGIVNAMYVSEHGTIPPANLEEAMNQIALLPDFDVAVRDLIDQKRSGTIESGHRIHAIDICTLPIHRSTLVKDNETPTFPREATEAYFRNIIRHP